MKIIDKHTFRLTITPIYIFSAIYIMSSTLSFSELSSANNVLAKVTPTATNAGSVQTGMMSKSVGGSRKSRRSSKKQQRKTGGRRRSNKNHSKKNRKSRANRK